MIGANLETLGLEPATTGSVKPKSLPATPTRSGGIGALLEGLGGGSPAAPKKDRRAAEARPSAASPAR